MRPHLNRVVAVGVLAAAAVVCPTYVASAGPAEPVVPSELAVPDGNKLFRVGHGVGVQVYSCNATASGPAWAFVAPRADLYDDHSKLIMIHFAGPSWEARDGSTVVGRRVAGVTVDPTAVGWLKLSAVTTSAGADGDLLVHTSFIQRLATSGGVAPAPAQCTSETVGLRAEVPYTADYYFWKPQDE